LTHLSQDVPKVTENQPRDSFGDEIDARINICICTCRRAELLKKCLASIAVVDVPERVQIHVSIIDNDDAQSAADYIALLKKDYPFVLHYQHVMSSGIPYARNRAIDLTLELKCDYLAFIDDDEWVEIEWLKLLYGYSRKVGGEAIVSGHVIQELPDNVSKTVARFFTKRERGTGTALSACATNNVLIPVFIMADLGLRFVEENPHMGGEDTIFFTLASQKGVPIYKCAEAIVHEVIPESKANMAWLSRRKFRVGIISAWRKKKYGRSRLAICVNSVLMVILCFGFAVLLAIALQHELRNKYWLKMCKYLGVVAGVFGASMDDYKVIHGE